MRNRTKTMLMDAVCILVGCALIALGLSVFTIPNRIAPGGISGVATAISHLFHIRVGTLTLLLNIPLLLLAWKRMGIKPLIKTIAATVLLSVLIDAFSLLLPAYNNNALLAALTGGVLTGGGMGILLIRGISTGGTDLIGLLIYSSKPRFSMGQILMVIDVLVVLFAVVVFRDLDVALYSIVTIAVASKAIDTLQQGIDKAKVIYIVTDMPEAILAKLADEMGRGVTVLPAKGGFSKKEKAVLMTIARRSEVSSTLQVARAIDPRAFTIVSDATAVYGEGFKD